MSDIEILASLVSAAGVWLTIRRKLLCWPVSLTACVFYAWIFAKEKLYADAGLQGVFAALILYGWVRWYQSEDDQGQISVVKPSFWQKASGLGAGTLLALCLWQGLKHLTADPAPFADGTLTAFSLIGQYWMARRYRESWLLWIVVDAAYVGLFVSRDMIPTAILYAAFTALAVTGYRKWTSPIRKESFLSASLLPEAAPGRTRDRSRSQTQDSQEN